MPRAVTLPEVQEQVVTRPEELRACCEHLGASRRFGLDTEFVGEDSYHPHLCLVQVATAERLFLIDPLSAGPLDCFWDLVTDPANEVVVHAGREEVRLCLLWTGRTPGRFFDLQIAAGLVGLSYPMGHGALVHQLLGVQLPKGETLTEWRNRPLTPAQVRYAFDDVRYLLPLWERLDQRLEALGRRDWAREEFERLRVWSTPEETPVERWRKLRGLGSLDRRRLGVVRALYQWREETAARTNRPARAVCRDDLLVEIARRNPTREQDLRVIRGLPRRDLGAIVETVREARSLPAEQLPPLADREQDSPKVQWVTNVLNAVLGDLCVRRHLAPGLVATSQDVKLLVRAHFQSAPPPAGSLLTQGWRAANVLPELLAILEGRRGIRLAAPDDTGLFTFTDVPAADPAA
jgi:ribonuclease D